MSWWRRLVRGKRMDEELDAELQFHFDSQVAEKICLGMSENDARRSCRLEFGGLAQVKEECRESRGTMWVESVMQDLRFALRQFRKAPGFAMTAILVVGLGIAASVSIFAFINAALLKPLPYQNPSRLVAVFAKTAACPECPFSYLDFQDWKRNNSVFQSFEIWEPEAYLWRSPAGVQALRIGRVSGGFFETLAVKPAFGRLFIPTDDTPSSTRTVVLPYATWMHLFGARVDIVGQTITLDSAPYTVIGVLPQDFHFAPRAAELWVTIHDLSACEKDRSCRPFSGIGRLKDGFSVSSALADTNTIAARLQKLYPKTNQGQGALVLPLGDYITGDIRPTLLVLLAGSVLLLLIACINVASLFLVRAEKRRNEMAVRTALGASTGRLTRQLVVEAVLLVALSVLWSSAVAYGVVRLLAALIPERVLRGMPYFQTIAFDYRVFIFALSVSLIALAMCTGAPLSRFYGTDLAVDLAGGTRSSSGAWRRFGSSLVVIELATAIVLLAAAGILGKSFYLLLNVNLNFNPAHLATFEIDASSGYDTDARSVALSRGLIDAMNAVPSVKSAAIVSTLPVTCNCYAQPYRVQGHAWNGTQQSALSRTVSSTYFATLQTGLLKGRLLSETDDASHPPVAVVNRTMARLFFGGEDPVGQVIGDETLSPNSRHQIVGVVDDVREATLDDVIRPAVYVSVNQNPETYTFMVVRTTQDPMAILPELAAAVHRLDPGIGVRNEFSMTEHIHDGSASYLRSSATWLVGGFAACALLLGVVGLYGVVSYSVSQRTREIGVRMALGAGRSSISHLIVGEAADLVVVGLVFGIAASLVTGRFLRSFLFGVRSWDPSVLIGVCVVLAAATFLATWIPARRASATDPIEALRNE